MDRESIKVLGFYQSPDLKLIVLLHDEMIGDVVWTS